MKGVSGQSVAGNLCKTVPWQWKEPSFLSPFLPPSWSYPASTT